MRRILVKHRLGILRPRGITASICLKQVLYNRIDPSVLYNLWHGAVEIRHERQKGVDIRLSQRNILNLLIALLDLAYIVIDRVLDLCESLHAATG